MSIIKSVKSKFRTIGGQLQGIRLRHSGMRKKLIGYKIENVLNKL